MPTRRHALLGAASALCAPAVASALAPALAGPARAAGAAGAAGADLPLNDDGLYHQDWFHGSFLDMAEDHAEAAAAGRHLMVLVEQHGCPYCRELHKVNFARQEISDFIQEQYTVIQINMWGDREVTDFDGEVLSEKRLCNKWFVSFTPTTLMFNARDAGARDLRAAEAFRLPGYFKPFHYMTGLEYGASPDYRDQPFQRFLQDRYARLEAMGITPDMW